MGNPKKLYKKNNLKYFELIISNEIGNNNGLLSLFEQSVQYSLNKPYKETGIKESDNKNSNNQGYKIENTHFRLGSKIHIRDFYYAKRLFQNSFFSTPFAFLIARHIYPQLKRNEKYSLIGYENYSSFLISSVRNLIEKKIENDTAPLKTKDTRFTVEDRPRINHSTISKDGIPSREVKSFNKNTRESN